jgi:uncharacterized protein YlzI (FlbEa/FlbD family)
MAEKKTTPVTIDGKEYVFEDMTQEQQTMVNHVADLERKIGSTTFNLDQLKVGQQAFIKLLKESLEKQPETVE